MNFSKVGIGSKLIYNFIGVLFFVELIKGFVDSSVVAHSNQLPTLIAIVRGEGNCVGVLLRYSTAHSFHLLVIKFIIASYIIIRTVALN